MAEDASRAIAREYHQATKHDWESVRQGEFSLDWANQPDPFRVYEGAQVFPLPQGRLPDAGLLEVLAGVAGTGHADPPEEGIPFLGTFLHHSLAISAWKEIPSRGFRYSLRVDPSSGNLHPTECHLALAGFRDLPDGLYHYRVAEHALELRRSGDAVGALAAALDDPAAAGSRMVLVLTSVFWREAWKYRDRAYRYCLLDAGHVLCCLLSAGRALGLAGRVRGHFVDAALADVLAAAPDEAPLAAVVFGGGARRTAAGPGGEPGPPLSPPMGQPNRLSAAVRPHPVIEQVHAATLLAAPVGTCPVPGLRGPADDADSPLRHVSVPAEAEAGLPPGAAEAGATFGRIVRKRRSAHDFQREHSVLPYPVLAKVLDLVSRGYRADYRGSADGGGRSSAPGRGGGRGLLTYYLYAHRVDGLASGCYRWRPGEPELVPQKLGDLRETAAFISLEQGLGGNGACAFSMVADLEGALDLWGPRGYRYLHMNAGWTGGLFYLVPHAHGLGATGMGAFYDDDVHRFLGLEPAAGQVVYHFGIGLPTHDDRLVTQEIE